MEAAGSGEGTKTEIENLKHTLRQLKKQERRARFGAPDAGNNLVWDSFFSTREQAGSERYPMGRLRGVSPEELREIVGEYFLEVYLRLYQDNGEGSCFEPELLRKLGLRADAEEREVRRRFRELAKQLHPDCGGDSGQFIELMEIYRGLIGGERKGG